MARSPLRAFFLNQATSGMKAILLATAMVLLVGCRSPVPEPQLQRYEFKSAEMGTLREEVRRLFGAASVRDEDWGCEVSAGGDGLRLKFDAAGRLDTWWWYP